MDFFLADQLTSLVRVFIDFLYSFCFFFLERFFPMVVEVVSSVNVSLPYFGRRADIILCVELFKIMISVICCFCYLVSVFNL